MPRRETEALLLLCGLLCAAGAQAFGGVYKWVDRSGVTRYDDHSLLAERLTRASIARGGVAADAKATVPAAFVELVEQQCVDLKERSASYSGATSVYGRDPAGNEYRFSRNQVALEVRRLNEQAFRYCRPLAAQYVLAELRAESLRRDAMASAPAGK